MSWVARRKKLHVSVVYVTVDWRWLLVFFFSLNYFFHHSAQMERCSYMPFYFLLWKKERFHLNAFGHLIWTVQVCSESYLKWKLCTVSYTRRKTKRVRGQAFYIIIDNIQRSKHYRSNHVWLLHEWRERERNRVIGLLILDFSVYKRVKWCTYNLQLRFTRNQLAQKWTR